jgi:DnaK suppressor protein
MRDRTTEGQLRRELDSILVRLEAHGRAASIAARSEDARLVGDMFADAQVVASRDLGELADERLHRRARVLMNALERVRDGSYGVCEGCGGTIPPARRRALPGVTTCVPCQERGERYSGGFEPPESIARSRRIRHRRGLSDERGILIDREW